MQHQDASDTEAAVATWHDLYEGLGALTSLGAFAAAPAGPHTPGLPAKSQRRIAQLGL